MGNVETFDLVRNAAVGTWREQKAELARRNRLIRYWPRLLDGLHYSPQLFYSKLVERLQTRKIPNLEMEPVFLRQSGIFSPSRLYLQFRRERFVFEICAAPFGNGFFCSERLYDRRREARWYHYLLVFGLVALLYFASLQKADTVHAVIIVTGIVAFFWSMMRLSVLPTMLWLEDQLYDIPLLGPVYQSLFHPETYFRQDQNACYSQAVHLSVLETINDILEEKGQRTLSPDEAEVKLSDVHLN